MLAFGLKSQYDCKWAVTDCHIIFYAHFKSNKGGAFHMKRFDPKPVLNTERFEACFKAIDAHTEGEFCRVVYAGFPRVSATPFWTVSTICRSTMMNIVRL